MVERAATFYTTFPSGQKTVEVDAVQAGIAARLAAVATGDRIDIACVRVVRLATLFCPSACVTAATALRKAPSFVEFPYVYPEPDLVNERLPY